MEVSSNCFRSLDHRLVISKIKQPYSLTQYSRHSWVYLPACTAVDTRLLFTTSSHTKHRKQTAPMPSRDYLSASLTPSLSLSLPSSFLHGCCLLWTKQNQRTSTVHTLQQTECCSTVTQLYLTPVASHFPLARQLSKLGRAINSLFVTHVYESKETPAPSLTFWRRSFTFDSKKSPT